MSKVLTVIGATGTQGGSVISAMLNHPGYTLRAVTRNNKSEKARLLSDRGVQVVEANLNDLESLKQAFQGSQAIFAVTNFFETLAVTSNVEESMHIESQQARNLAGAAAATTGLEHYIWSSLPNASHNTGGRFNVSYMASKNAGDDYIRTSLPALWAKTTLVWFAWYATNMQYPIYSPSALATFEDPEAKQTKVYYINVPVDTPLPMLGSAEVNPGLWVRAILQQPEVTLPGKAVAAVEKQITYEELVTAHAKASRGNNATEQTKLHIVQVSRKQYAEMWPTWGPVLGSSHDYMAALPGKSFSSVSGDIEVLGKDDLTGLEGLVSTEEAFVRMFFEGGL